MDLQRARIAVTGATGFLGRYLVEGLLGRGARVVAVVRNPQKAPELADLGVELRRADLAEPEALAEGFAGCDAVVSNAGLFALGYRRSAEYLESNLQGTRNVLEAAARAGATRIVQVSSAIVYRPGAPKPIHEDTPLRERPRVLLPWNVYAYSKTLAEREAWRLAGERGLRLSTVRPTGIYGAFDPNLMKTHKLLMRPPLSVYPALFDLNPVYAGDVADAVARILERDGSVGRAYNVAREDGTAWELMRAWREAGGRVPALVLPLPVPVRLRFSIERARRELGFTNRPLVEGLRETLAAEAAGPRARRIPVSSATKAPLVGPAGQANDAPRTTNRGDET